MSSRRIRKSFNKFKDAEAELAKRVSIIAEGLYLDVKNEYKTTMGEMLGRYEDNFQDQPCYKTSKGYMLKNIRTYFGEDRLLSSIKYVHLEENRSHLKRKIGRHKRFLSHSIVHRGMSCLGHVLKKAAQWEMMAGNPFNRGVSLLIKESNI